MTCSALGIARAAALNPHIHIGSMERTKRHVQGPDPADIIDFKAALATGGKSIYDKKISAKQAHRNSKNCSACAFLLSR